jgi:hypothetical protein
VAILREVLPQLRAEGFEFVRGNVTYTFEESIDELSHRLDNTVKVQEIGAAERLVSFGSDVHNADVLVFKKTSQ